MRPVPNGEVGHDVGPWARTADRMDRRRRRQYTLTTWTWCRLTLQQSNRSPSHVDGVPLRVNLVFLAHLYNDGATPDPTANVPPDFRHQMARAELNAIGYALYSYDAGGQRVPKVVVKSATVEERRSVGGWEVWRKRPAERFRKSGPRGM